MEWRKESLINSFRCRCYCDWICHFILWAFVFFWSSRDKVAPKSEDWLTNGRISEPMTSGWVGGREIFEQVRILPTISQIPALVPGDSASHEKPCPRPLGPWCGATWRRNGLISRCFDSSILKSSWCSRPETLILLKTYINSGFQYSFGSKWLHNWPLNKAGGRATCTQLKIRIQLSWPSTEVDSKTRWRIQFSNWGLLNSWMQNTGIWRVDYIYRKNIGYKWIHTIQTCVVQGSNV